MSTRSQSAHHKRAFLEAFAEHGNITTAAKSAGISRRVVYKWQEHDADFLVAFHEAEAIATEVLEAEARRRAVEGVTQETPIYQRGEHVGTIVKTEYSDTLLIFLLKARAPEKYRETIRVDIRQEAEKLAAKYGLTVTELVERAEAIANGRV